MIGGEVNMRKKIIFFVSFGIFLIFFLSNNTIFSNDTLQPQNIKQKPKVKITDKPIIRYFRLNPDIIIKNTSEPLVFSWKVDPFSGGTRITQVVIMRSSGSGPNINYRAAPSEINEGTHELRIRPVTTAGETIYTLTATNGAGNVATSIVRLLVETMDSLKKKMKITSVSSSPDIFPEDRSYLRINFTVSNTGKKTIRGKIKVFIEVLGRRTKIAESSHSNHIFKPGNSRHSIGINKGKSWTWKLIFRISIYSW